MKKIFEAVLPDLIAVILFVALSFIFFSPVIEGKVLVQGDMTHARGTSAELDQYEAQTGQTAMWTNSLFSGMPAYLIKAGKSYNIFHFLQPVLRLYLPFFTVGILFVYLFGFYFLLRVLKIKALTAFLGASAFAFGSYNLIIIAAGHVTKAYAIAYMAPVLAGIILTFQGKYIIGGLVTLFATGIQISMSHYQITYYTFLMVGVYILFKLIESSREKAYRHFLISVAIIAGSVFLSILPNSTNLFTVYEYGKYSTRGQSELTNENGEISKALPRDYILNDYSFGIGEPFGLLIPNFKGGPTVSPLSTNSEIYKLLLKNGYPQNEARQVIQRMPTYFGSQRGTAGPVYAGAIVFFLFVLAMFIFTGTERWWILTAIGFSIALAWGKNFPALSNFFIDYFPAYGKFRTVSMIMVIASLLIPYSAITALSRILRAEVSKKDLMKYLKYSFGITGGFLLLVGVFGPGAFDFKSANDSSLPDVFIQAIHADRGSLLRADAFRSLGFVTVTAVLLWALLTEKIKQNVFLIALTVLVLSDLWVIDKRYVNETNFTSARASKNEFTPTAADRQIMQDTSYYRVLNLTVDPFNDATTSYFHKSIGGYHGAKMKRYQDLIERQISRNNMNVIDMLNTKYIIIPDKEKRSQLVNQNPDALGNCWFVDSLIWVDTPDQEMASLNSFDPAKQAIINAKFMDMPGISGIEKPSEGDTIYLTSYKPDELGYRSITSGNRFAVMSDIYYPKGWHLTIDGNESQHAQVDYVLRGMVIPAGDHEIKFVFRSQSYNSGKNVAMASSALVILLLLGGIYTEYRKKK
ncbi:MAG: hypothetical protein H6538_04140 [Bacteroidales bacterium]|nr:hypothetical protein [Bacteroidales bacterium]MCB8998740.1 hypothetical protein [Bacteroidales bacterium]